jgi:hypothetical protein
MYLGVMCFEGYGSKYTVVVLARPLPVMLEIPIQVDFGVLALMCVPEH